MWCAATIEAVRSHSSPTRREFLVVVASASVLSRGLLGGDSGTAAPPPRSRKHALSPNRRPRQMRGTKGDAIRHAAWLAAHGSAPVERQQLVHPECHPLRIPERREPGLRSLDTAINTTFAKSVSLTQDACPIRRP